MKIKVRVLVYVAAIRAAFGEKQPHIAENTFEIQLSPKDLFNIIIGNPLNIDGLACILQKNDTPDFEVFEAKGFLFHATLRNGKQEELDRLTEAGWKLLPETMALYKLPWK